MTAVTRVAVNEPVRVGAGLRRPEPGDFPGFFCKYAMLDDAAELAGPWLAGVLSACPVLGSRKFLCVDVKVSDLASGECTCIPGWHCDVTTDLLHPSRDDVHHIFVTGRHALTEFVSTQMDILVGESCPLSEQVRQIEANGYDIWRVPSCTWVTYGRRNYHRGPVSTGAERRLLVRVTETDVVRPSRIRP